MGLALLVLAVCGISVPLSHAKDTIVFLVDLSESNAANLTQMEQYMSRQVKNMPKNNQYAIVTFGANAVVEQFLTSEKHSFQILSAPEQNADSDTRDNVLGDVHNAADVFIFADDQVASMVAGGALYPVPNADEVKKANVEGAIDAATVDDTLYAYPMTADIETRQAIADYLNKTYETAFSADNFYLTMGAALFLFVCFRALTTSPEDESGSHPCPPYSFGTGIPMNPYFAIFATVSAGTVLSYGLFFCARGFTSVSAKSLKRPLSYSSCFLSKVKSMILTLLNYDLF